MDRVALIYRVLSGEASPAEKQELEDWIAKSPENNEEFEDLRLLWESVQEAEPVTDLEHDQGFEKIRMRVYQHLRRKRAIRSLLYILAAITLGLIVVLMVQKLGSGSVGNRFDEVTMNSIINVLENRYHIKVEVRNQELLRCRFTGSFYRVQDEREVLRSIEHALDVEFVALNNTRYRLIGNRCAGL